MDEAEEKRKAEERRARWIAAYLCPKCGRPVSKDVPGIFHRHEICGWYLVRDAPGGSWEVDTSMPSPESE